MKQQTRSIDELTASGIAVIKHAFLSGGKWIACLFSGGHDSTVACHIASQHPMFDGRIHHIDTTIGTTQTRRHVEMVCHEFGWKLEIYTNKYAYRKFVILNGFPGPGAHPLVYAHLKERCVRMIEKGKTILISGARQQESDRRMGNVMAAVQVGELQIVNGKRKRVNKNRYWTAPCFDWSHEEQESYMQYHSLPRNPFKDKFGMSGECLCGCFASPGELDRIRVHAPEVAAEIDALTSMAEFCGVPSEWGKRPQNGVIKVERAGPLCSGCEIKAKANGVVFQ